ncbi:MAG: hypothetical protein JOZ69_17295, partial [Myxococcales bacterium]|nr:hypothetical protein [Myxococcales bacterium]
MKRLASLVVLIAGLGTLACSAKLDTAPGAAGDGGGGGEGGAPGVGGAVREGGADGASSVPGAGDAGGTRADAGIPGSVTQHHSPPNKVDLLFMIDNSPA